MSAVIGSIGNVGTINGVAIFPAGTLIDYLGSTAPAGFFPMDGRAIKKADYPELFAVLGNTYDTFDGATAPASDEFRIPKQSVDGLGLFMRGVGSSVGVGHYEDFAVQQFNGFTLTFGEQMAAVQFANGMTAGRTNQYMPQKSTSQTQGLNDIEWSPTIGGLKQSNETRPRSLTVLKCISAGREII
jgi:hypothetical protein